jgi:hypothetical protein
MTGLLQVAAPLQLAQRRHEMRLSSACLLTASLAATAVWAAGEEASVFFLSSTSSGGSGSSVWSGWKWSTEAERQRPAVITVKPSEAKALIAYRLGLARWYDLDFASTGMLELLGSDAFERNDAASTGTQKSTASAQRRLVVVNGVEKPEGGQMAPSSLPILTRLRVWI